MASEPSDNSDEFIPLDWGEWKRDRCTTAARGRDVSRRQRGQRRRFRRSILGHEEYRGGHGIAHTGFLTSTDTICIFGRNVIVIAQRIRSETVLTGIARGQGLG